MMLIKACYKKHYKTIENSYQIGDFYMNEPKMHTIYNEFKTTNVLLKDFAIAIIIQKHFPCKEIIKNYSKCPEKLKLLSDCLSELEEIEQKISCAQDQNNKNIDYLVQQKKFALEKFQQCRAEAIIEHFNNQKLSIIECATEAIDVFEKNHDIMQDKESEQKKFKDKKNK